MIKYATVVNVSNEGFNIRFNGEKESSPRVYKKLASYKPKIGDRVAILYDGNTYLVLGTID